MAEDSNDDLLEPNPIVKRIMEGGTAGKRVVRMVGYVGPPEVEDHVRLFRNLSLTEYWDIPRADVLHVEKGAGTRACVALTIRSEEKIRHTRVGSVGPTRRDLLGGALFERALRSSGGAMARMPQGGTALISTLICTIIIVSTLICFPDTIDPDPPDPEPPI